MRRFVMAGVFFEVALLIVGLTWVRPLAGGDDGAERGPQAAAAGGFRTLGAGSGEVVEVELSARQEVQEIAPGVRYRAWTFNGTAPGPVIRVRQGDTVRFTIRNDDPSVSHSIDFHAAQTPWDVNYQPVAPGESLTFDWVARFPGVFMYHCGVPPVLHHIANGMYGAIVVEPAESLPPAREYVLVSSEFYPGKEPVEGVFEGDMAAMEAVDPEYVVFDGRANRYLDEPLQARPGELIRLWVVNAGPTLEDAFHVIGALFDHVYPSGNPTSALNGLQTWGIPPGDGGMFELTIPDEGLYPFVTHAFAYTDRGSVGVIQVSADARPAPESYPRVADPFGGGVLPAEGASTAEPTEQPSTEPSPTGDDDGGEAPASGGGGITVQAEITGFAPGEIEVPAGEVTLEVVNTEAMIHDLTIDELDVHVMLDPNATATTTFRARPGTYEFYCSVPGHREAGMVGSLVVTS